jgi:predicted TIM-barrel fold metal-dependent hydrolase
MYDNAISAANKYRNLYLCLCGPSISHLQKIVDGVDSDRILFGTDFGFTMSFASLIYRLDMWNYVSMGHVVKEKLFYRNAEVLIPV